MSAFEGVNVRRHSNLQSDGPRRRSTLTNTGDASRRRPSWAPSAAQSESWMAIDAEIQAAQQAEEAKQKQATPLPLQLWVVVLMRLAEPMAFAQIFPYINRMIYDIGAVASPADVGFYGGMIESLFALTQLMTVLPWASLSDRWGRRPIMLFGLLGVFVSQVLFGFSTSIGHLIFARCLAGALNGNVAVLKSVVGEITDDSNRAKAFQFLPVTWALGCSMGSLVGGYLAHPEEQFPGVFGKDGILSFNGFWLQYPYSLPCLVTAASIFAGVILGYFCLDETLPSLVTQAENERNAAEHAEEEQPLLNQPPPSYQALSPTQEEHEASSSQAVASPTQQEPPQEGGRETGVLDMMRIPHIQNVLVSYGLLALCAVSLDAVYVLYFFTPISSGGLALSSTQTGRVLFTFGLGAVVVQSVVFTSLQKRFGTLKVYRISLACWPLTAAVLPIATMVAQSALPPDVDETGKTINDLLPARARALVWTVIVLSNLFRLGASMGFSANNLLVNQAVVFVEGEKLGTLNGLAQAASSLTRAIGPYGSTCLFAWSIEMGLSYLIWPIFVVLGTLAVASTMQMADLEIVTIGNES